MEKRNVIVSITLILCLAIILSCAGYFCYISMSGGIITPPQANVALATTSTMSADGYPVINVSATVQGATSNEVVWSLDWENAGDSSQTSSYVTLSSNGLTATLTCIAKFDDNMLLKCSVPSDNVTASCVVRYAGHPTAVTLVPSTTPDAIKYAHQEYTDFYYNDTEKAGNEYNDIVDLGTLYDFGDTETVYLDLKYSNAFGEITSSDFINQNVTISVARYGSITMKPYDPDRGSFYENLGTISYQIGQTDNDDILKTFVTATFENGKIKIERKAMNTFAFAGYSGNQSVEYRYWTGGNFGYAITVTAQGLNGEITSQTIFVRPILNATIALSDTSVVL